MNATGTEVINPQNNRPRLSLDAGVSEINFVYRGYDNERRNKAYYSFTIIAGPGISMKPFLAITMKPRLSHGGFISERNFYHDETWKRNGWRLRCDTQLESLAVAAHAEIVALINGYPPPLEDPALQPRSNDSGVFGCIIC